MTIRTTTTRKRHPRTILALVVLFALACHVGAYFINLDEGYVIYIDARWEDIGPSGVAPQFIVAQDVSEVAFWPVFQVHRLIHPQRFDYDTDGIDPNAKSSWPSFRDKWW